VTDTPAGGSAGASAGRRARVAVVGGGVSGLTAAWRLTDPAAGREVPDVVLLEGRDAVGGVVRVGDVGGVRLDLGAESLLARRPEAVELAREAGLGDDLVHPATSSAAVVVRGTLRPLPAGTVLGVPGDPRALGGVLTPDEVARVAAERDLPREPLTADVDVASWVGGRVGRAVVDSLVEPLLGGVYAGHAARLSLRATLPQVWDAATRGESLLDAVAAVVRAGTAPAGQPAAPVFAGIAGGVGRLPEALAGGLAARGVEIRTRTTVRGLRRTAGGWRLELGDAARTGGAPAAALDVDGVVLAVPPAAAARLLARDVPAAAAELADVATASVALVSALVPRADLEGVTGSGLLVPPVEGRAIKAATFSAAKWSWVDALDPRLVGLRMSLGRAGEEAVLQRPDAELVALATRDLAELLRRPVDPVATRVTRWGGGLPQYGVGHVERVARVREAVAAAPGLAICGAVLDGVGIPACVSAAGRAAGDLVAHLAGRGARMPA
jgi:oxygen-dependent protoporphyrinogen oxidase